MRKSSQCREGSTRRPKGQGGKESRAGPKEKKKRGHDIAKKIGRRQNYSEKKENYYTSWAGIAGERNHGLWGGLAGDLG